MRTLLPVVIAAATILCVVALPLFSEHPDVYTVHTEVAADGTVVRKPKLMSVTHLRRQQQAPGPKAQVDSAVHDFGRMDPLTVREHVFVIRNVGDAPLELTEGPTTCKCTLASLGQRTVPPGGKAHVVVQWNSGRDPAYAHSATIYTNDPLHKALQLSIKGTVATMFRAVPEQLVFSRVTPGDTPSATAVVYSQLWDDMELEPIEPSLDGMVVTISEVDTVEKDPLQARSARRITVTLPADLPEGYFATPLTIHGKPAGGTPEQAADCELGIEGKVIRRLAVYGPEIDVNGTIDMGRVRQGNSRPRAIADEAARRRTPPAGQKRPINAVLPARVGGTLPNRCLQGTGVVLPARGSPQRCTHLSLASLSARDDSYRVRSSSSRTTGIAGGRDCHPQRRSLSPRTAVRLVVY